ncbi:hypothetical protein [uncultured Flavobacterium sp.]|uniref:hypothetical protein n=1 Tax=uncultured Flavobacterium sp. TaxID=165435 RepID=UPI0029315A16|nr:hypothetical protein [uncultured Flavobacterium sp.]
MKDNLTIKTIVVFCEKMAMGGTETMIMRLLSWYSLRGFRVLLLTMREIESTSILNDLNKIDFEHYVYNFKKREFCNSKNICLSFQNNEKVWVNTQFIQEFLRCYSLLKRSKYNCYFVHNLFIVHPFSTFLFNKYFNFLGKKLIKILLTNKNLVFMDEECVNASVDFYKLDVKKFKFDILRLPFLINTDNYSTVIKSKQNNFNILTIARFEFPFKGYVLGLISSFENIFNTYEGEISLTIIGYGRDKPVVDELIDSLPIEISSKIQLLDEIPYSKIGEYIEKCSVFIGMGTTILDAANLNKIVIVPVCYQNSNLTTGYFHENFNIIGEIYREESVYETFDNLILKTLNYSQADFNKISNKSKEVLIEHYDINMIANNLFTHTNKVHSFIHCQIINCIANLCFFIVYIYNKMIKI